MLNALFSPRKSLLDAVTESPRRKQNERHHSEVVAPATVSNLKGRRRTNSDPVKIKKTEKTLEKETFVAQLMSGWRDPNTLTKETKPHYSREDYYTIAYTFYSVMTPEIFFKQLLDAYKSENKAGKRLCINNAEIFIKALIRVDFRNEFLDEVEKNLKAFFKNLERKEKQPHAAILDSLLKEIALARARKYHADKIMQVTSSVDHEVDLSTHLREDLNNRLTFNFGRVEKFAADLKEYQITLMKQIKLSEFHDGNFLKFPNGKGPKLAVNDCAVFFNHLADRVVTEILLAKRKKHQQRIYDFFAKTIEESIKIDDYQTACSILAGLNYIHISRLSFLKTERKEKVEELFNNKNNFKNYRAHLEKRMQDKDAELVPCLNILQRDLTFVEQGNPKVLENQKANEEYMQLAGQVHYRQFLKYQKKYLSRPSKPFETNIATWLKGVCLNEDLAYFLSTAILPSLTDEKPIFDDKRVAATVCYAVTLLKRLQQSYKMLKGQYDEVEMQDEKQEIYLQLLHYKKSADGCREKLLQRKKTLLAALKLDKEAPEELRSDALCENERLDIAMDYLFAEFTLPKKKDEVDKMIESFGAICLTDRPSVKPKFSDDLGGSHSQAKTNRSRSLILGANLGAKTKGSCIIEARTPLSARSDIDAFTQGFSRLSIKA